VRPLVVAPLAGWNVRGYSYAEHQTDGHLHPGADLNVGYGDDDLGLPVCALAAGTVVHLATWDGASYGYGTHFLIEHDLGAPAQFGHPGPKLWALYAHLDRVDTELVVGATVTPGQPIGSCGKSGLQRWAHLHLELRYDGPPATPPDFWGGRLTPEQLGERYADPFTVLRVLGALPDSPGDLPLADDAYAVLRQDRDFNFRLKQLFEHELRMLEARRRLKRGTVVRLIAAA
jgi:murein DD-endopeptidase MepM/ murein hydrolase activator NlpD